LKKVLECVFINSAQMAIAIETARIKHYSYLQHHHLVAWYWAEQFSLKIPQILNHLIFLPERV